MKLYNKENLKNSRIFFDKNTPRFMTFLIYFIVFILIIGIYASSKINKNYIVKAQGQISDKNVAYISSNVNGSIKEIVKKEGDFVKAGDTILIISNGEENTQRLEYKNILKENEEKIKLLEKYRKSLDEKKNLLKDEGAEQEYYGKVEYYLNSLKNENQSSGFTKEDILKKENKINEKISEREKLNAKISKLEKDKKYYENLVKYYEELNYKIVDLEEEIVNYQNSSNIDEKILKEKQNKLKDLKIEYRKSTKAQEEKSKIDSEYENTKSKYEGLKTEIDSLREEISQLNRQNLSGKQSEQIYLQFVNEIGSEIKNIEKTNLDIKMNISVLKNRDTNYEIKASKDGQIHYVNPLKEGVNVQVNQTLIELSTLDKNNFYVDTYINIYDISKVKVNQEVDIAILGVNTYKYGTLKGKLVAIEDGVVNIQGQEGSNSFYKAKVEIENKYLEKNNEKIDLLLSMPVEARIIYDKETYLEYVLEKLNFKE